MFGFVRVLREDARAIMFALGTVRDPPRGPGPCGGSRSSTSREGRSAERSPSRFRSQEVITKDNVPVRVNAVAYFKIVDREARSSRSRTSWSRPRRRRDDAARRPRPAMLDELLSEREKTNEILQGTIDEATGRWGIKVAPSSEGRRDPVGMQRAMASSGASAIGAERSTQRRARRAPKAMIGSDRPAQGRGEHRDRGAATRSGRGSATQA